MPLSDSGEAMQRSSEVCSVKFISLYFFGAYIYKGKFKYFECVEKTTNYLLKSALLFLKSSTYKA